MAISWSPKCLSAHEHASSRSAARSMLSPGSGESTKCLNVRAGFPRQGASVPKAARVASISASQAQASLASSPSAPASRSS